MSRLRIALPIVALLAVGLAWAASPKGDPPETGDDAPDFELESNEGTPVSLADYTGRWVVLYFYPKDFTSGCTIQARRFQEDQEEFDARDAVVLGVSVDDAETHAEFCAEEGLNFKLLADTDGAVSRAYGSVRGTAGAVISARNTFLIDPQGKVAEVWIGASPHTNSDEALAAIDRLKGDA